MATVRIYYSREDQNYDDYYLYYMPGIHFGNKDLLFPDNDYAEGMAESPRASLNFVVDGNLAYVDLDLNGAKVCDIYIRRKDFGIEYNGELCASNNIPHDPLCNLCLETGYKYTISENLYSSVYIKEQLPYLYTDATFNYIAPQRLTLTGTSTTVDTAEPLHEVVEHGESGLDYRWKYVKIYYTYKNATTIAIPQETLNNEIRDLGIDYSSIQLMLYLIGNTYTIGENMQLSIDADALAVEKADALQTVDKGIANCLYKLGEVPADFDEEAFLDDVAGYKAGKTDSLKPTVDYLEELLNTRPNLVA